MTLNLKERIENRFNENGGDNARQFLEKAREERRQYHCDVAKVAYIGTETMKHMRQHRLVHDIVQGREVSYVNNELMQAHK